MDGTWPQGRFHCHQSINLFSPLAFRVPCPGEWYCLVMLPVSTRRWLQFDSDCMVIGTKKQKLHLFTTHNRGTQGIRPWPLEGSALLVAWWVKSWGWQARSLLDGRGGCSPEFRICCACSFLPRLSKAFGWLVGGDSELWPSSNFPDRSIHHKTYNIHVAYTLSVWQECARSTTLRVKCWSAPQIKRCVGWQGVHLSPCAVFSRFPCSFMSMWNQRSCNGFGGQEVERQAASEWFDWDSFFCLLFAACLGYRDHFW